MKNADEFDLTAESAMLNGATVSLMNTITNENKQTIEERARENGMLTPNAPTPNE